MTKELSIIVCGIFIGLSFTSMAQEEDKKRLKWSPKVKAEAQASTRLSSQKDSQVTQQLEKAKLHNQKNAQRAERFKHEQKPDWENTLRKQANQEFKQAKQRTKKQLQRAKAAAKKSKKMSSAASKKGVIE
ncbi:hypothetical protein D5018_05475 [Parashewanella curva]|uniref:Uncharacterized protein n=1 Tax=Parashewanella curva TaxID=2338552 RepID=A0A3L8PZC1_9GAMM|nr:hypothetical protein [Parashewanella curva]RLV60724.1 hypothetical protein D5018_05475 [Parashewanella curva]